MFVNSLFGRVPQQFFSPDDSIGAITGDDPEVSLGDDEEDEDDDDNPDSDDDDGENDEEDEEGLEAKGDKGKGKGKDKDDEDDDPTLARIDFKEVKAKFPELFKEFPTLKHAFFREQQFTEIFPTVEDAQKAAEAQTAYEEITAAVVEGDVDKFLTELRSEGDDAFNKFAQNFLPSVRELNKDLYLDLITPSLQQFIKNVYTHGHSEKNENIKNAAKIVHKVLFGGAYEDIEKEIHLLAKGEAPKDDKVEADKKAYFAQKYNTLYNDVTSSCYTELDSEINKGLDDLTKSKPGLKNLLAKEIRARVLAEMEKDQTHIGRMHSLWKREQRNGFNGTLKNSFKATFLAKAKTLIPKMRAEARKEALGKEDKENKEEPTRLGGGRESKNNGKGKMTAERARAEGLTARGIFDS